MQKLYMINKISFIVLVLFSLFGVIFLSVFFHELSHKRDYERYVKKDLVCIVALPENFSINKMLDPNSAIGFYAFAYNSSNAGKISEIHQSTEFRAYFISTIITLLWMIAFFIEFVLRMEQKQKV